MGNLRQSLEFGEGKNDATVNHEVASSLYFVYQKDKF